MALQVHKFLPKGENDETKSGKKTEFLVRLAISPYVETPRNAIKKVILTRRLVND